MLNDSQISSYLERISFKGELTPSRSTLDALTYRHQRAVPFETIAIHRTGKTPDLDIETLYERIVERRRGGYCFELNTLFNELLTSIGFDAWPVLSRAVRGREQIAPINHRGIIATTEEGPCMVDVGYGGPTPSGSLLLVDGLEQCIQEETFTPRRQPRGWWSVERVSRGALDGYDDEVPPRRMIELELCEAQMRDIDFSSLNVACSSPGSVFRDHAIANLRTSRGYLAYRDGVLTIRDAGDKSQIKAADLAEANEMLSRYFGLENLEDAS